MVGGQLLVHTLFSCIFFTQFNCTKSPIIKTFISGLCRCVAISRIYIMSAAMYYDEDFYSDTRGFSIEPDPQKSTENVFGDLEEIRAKLGNSISDPSLLKNIDNTVVIDGCSAKDIQALVDRIDFISCYHTVWEHISNHSIQGLKTTLTRAQNLLTELQSSSVRGEDMSSAFNLFRHRKLYSQTPLTPTLMSLEEGWSAYHSFFTQLGVLCDIVDAWQKSADKMPSDLEWLDTTYNLSLPVRSFLFNCMALHPVSLRIQAHPDIVTEAETTYAFHCKLVCLNPARHRRQIHHIALSYHALAGYDVPWAAKQFTRLAQTYYLLGFRLDLYADWEMAIVYQVASKLTYTATSLESLSLEEECDQDGWFRLRSLMCRLSSKICLLKYGKKDFSNAYFNNRFKLALLLHEGDVYTPDETSIQACLTETKKHVQEFVDTCVTVSLKSVRF